MPDGQHPQPKGLRLTGRRPLDQRSNQRGLPNLWSPIPRPDRLAVLVQSCARRRSAQSGYTIISVCTTGSGALRTRLRCTSVEEQDRTFNHAHSLLLSNLGRASSGAYRKVENREAVCRLQAAALFFCSVA